MDRKFELDYNKLEQNLNKVVDKWIDERVRVSKKIEIIPPTRYEIHRLLEDFASDLLRAVEQAGVLKDKDGT
jgi:hypothetical protein